MFFPESLSPIGRLRSPYLPYGETPTTTHLVYSVECHISVPDPGMQPHGRHVRDCTELYTWRVYPL